MNKTDTKPAAISPVQRLREIMARLRDPAKGCPWDRAQTFASLVPHTLEEAYEVASTIEQSQLSELCDELGDLLFQVVFYSRIAQEQGLFDFDDVATAICAKLERRHPHVFGDSPVADAEAQSVAWERLKADERRERQSATGVLDEIARALPALTRAAKLQKRAARVGFDWPSIAPVLDKVEEELGELRQALSEGSGRVRVEEEVGDLLFACVNVARHAGVDPEQALRGGNDRFERRFRHVEDGLRRQGMECAEATLVQKDALWEEAKRLEAGSSGREDADGSPGR
jgi:nucleoside triphosphate diphosphatase